MNGTREQKKKFTPPGEFAPHVDCEWIQDFTLELSLRGVSGDDIGAALAEVDSHCAESDEPAEQAFGPARDYARSLNLPASPEQAPGGLFKTVLPSIGQLLGMMLMIWSAPGLGTGEPATVSAGMLVVFAIVAAFILVINWKAVAVTGFVAGHRLLSFGMMVLFLAILVLPAFFLRGTAAELPPLYLLITGAALLAVATVTEYARSRTSRNTDDVLAMPLEDREAVSRRRRTLRRADYTRIFIMPVFAAALTSVLAITAAIS